MTKNIASAARPAPPLGEFREVDGRRLFAHRLGSGGPAVVFLPGASAVGLDYLAVQQGVSRFGTAVVYDRGGTGYSDPVPLPRTAAAVAAELRELLRAMDVPAPYVLVAHSLGGAYAHRFAQSHPTEVAGLVWLDGFHRDWDGFVPAAARLAADVAPDPARIPLLRPAVRETYTELLADYPARVRQPLIDAHASAEWLRAGIAERTNLAALAAELRAGPGIPDVPVVALTATGVDPGPQPPVPAQMLRELHEGMRKMGAAMAGAVSDGEQRVVADIGHLGLCCLRPDVVVQAVRDVIDRAARG